MQSQNKNFSSLFIIPTPIGNLGDITFRAIETLKWVDTILCEDTRVSGVLLQHYNISKPLLAFHQHNEHKILSKIILLLQEGKKLALITDAGTPGISDPAFLLVRECIKNNIAVETLPGATAFVPALINSGFPSDAFVFEGFLPLKKGRQSLLKKLAEEERTIILYESPQRLLKTLEEMKTFFGEHRPCCISRELTKMFEENFRGTISEAITHFSAKTIRGEIVMVVKGV